jgi:hypothetical protein
MSLQGWIFMLSCVDFLHRADRLLLLPHLVRREQSDR